MLAFFMRTNNLQNVKFVLKDDVRLTPIVGWTIQLAGFLFLTRQWAQDEKTVASLTEFWRSYATKLQVVVFPEGTDMTKKSLARSHEFAEKNNLPKWNYVLTPRSTGFVSLLTLLTGVKLVESEHDQNTEYDLSNSAIDAVYDLTIAYSPTHVQSELALLQGKSPSIVHILCERFPVGELPLSNENALKDWIMARFQLKEDRLTQFYTSPTYLASRRLAGLECPSDSNENVDSAESEGKKSLHDNIPSHVDPRLNGVPLLHHNVIFPTMQNNITTVIWFIVCIIAPYLLLDFAISFAYLSALSKLIISILLIGVSVYFFTIKKYNLTYFIADYIVPTLPHMQNRK